MPSEHPRSTSREETPLVLALSVVLAAASLAYCNRHGMLLLYGDAVAHLHIARRTFDSLNPGFRQLGSVWLPLPHLLLIPFVWRTEWWQNGLAGAMPSMVSYVFACAGMYKLARNWLEPTWAVLVFLAFALNPGLLYMSVTAMTEPLFLALFVWSAVLLVAFESATQSGRFIDARVALWRLTVILIAAVFTRYDGWILGTLAWLIAAVWTVHRRLWRQRALRITLVFCTLLLLAAPLFWLWYNWRFYGDALDFLRGPYSAKAIELRTTAPGSAHYPGYHSIRVAGLYYLKAATLGASEKHFGNIMLVFAYLGTALAIYRYRISALSAAFMLWMPLPFYAYSVAYSAVPIFIPIWTPFAYYNTRYGMEMLPVLALFPVFVAVSITKYKPSLRRLILGVGILLIVGNGLWLLHATPLVLKEAQVNSSTRIPFEKAIAKNLVFIPQQASILMYTSAHIGALQQLGFPLKQTINEGDYLLWRRGLENPAAAADVVAIDGDPVAAAVRLHPEGLQLMEVICTTGQPCARIYRSTIHVSQ